jgi:serine/threonine-protein kinase
VPPGRSASRDLTGKKIGGKYVVRSVLGEGGMGTVFEAEHITIGRSVAVKVLHPQQARKKDAVKRFHQEARAAGAIGHPNICEVYDLGTLDDGSPYLVMEKLVGETLADRIASEGGLPFDDVIDILTQVLSGLVAAHEKRIVHRDIKPENVFLTRRVGCPPVAKLLDFGVSKMIGPLVSSDEDLDLTRTGMVMGTPYYMSPEQARGDRNLDARVDLYACGVIMYEALTGRRPFTAANYNALLLQILTTKPRPARELRPALPHGFDAVLDKSMARAREDRYQNAAEFQRDLQGLRDRHQVAAPAIPAAVADLARQAFARMKPALPEPPRPIATPPPIHAATPPPIPSAMPQRHDTDRPPPAMPKPAPVIPRPRHARPPPPELVEARPTSTDVDPKLPPPEYEDPSPSSSSVEIPITFATETPLSGENMPVEPTQLNVRDLHRPATMEDFEDVPTEVRASPIERDDDHTTQKRGSEMGAMLANVVVDADGGATEIFVAKTSRRPPTTKPGSAPPEDATETLVKPNTFRRRVRSRASSSPDDTIKMGEDLFERLHEARSRVDEGSSPDVSKPRAPKR